MILKVLIYMLLMGVRSSRKIEALLKDSLVFMYLSGRQTPDFRTICWFRRDHLGEITALFDKVVELCMGLKMAKGEDMFCDGTKIRDNTSVKYSKTGKQLKKEIIKLKKEVREMLEEANNTDKEEDSLFGNANPYTGDKKVSSLLNHIETLERAYEEIAETGEKEHEEIEGREVEAGEKESEVHESTDPSKKEKKQNKKKEPKINTTDFDANIMQFSDKTCHPAYNGEVVVDGEENVIVTCHLTDEAIGHHRLQPLVEHGHTNGIHPDN